MENSLTMTCPRCHTPLMKIKTEIEKIPMCMSCFGHVNSERFVARLVTEATWKELLDISTEMPGERLKCPKCQTKMKQRRFHFPDAFVDLDLCSNCNLLWFDKDEIEQFPIRARKTLGAASNPSTYKTIDSEGTHSPGRPIHPDAKAQLLLARLKLDQLARHSRNRARYWRFQRIINTPWMVNALVQSFTNYEDFDDF